MSHLGSFGALRKLRKAVPHTDARMPLSALLSDCEDKVFFACVAAMNDPRLAVGDIGDFDTATLLEVLYAPPLVPGIAGFWLKWFDQTVNSQNQEIRFDSEDLNEYRLAPFVAPNVQGRVMRSLGFTVKTFRPAYIKVKHVVDPSRTIPRRAGEAPLGTLSLQDRFDAIVADNLRRARLAIENTWDWMACSAIVNGEVTVQGDDYPSVTVNFGRDPSATLTNSGAATWDQSTATVMNDIQEMRTNCFRLSRSPVNTLVFGLDAWNAFINPIHSDVQALLNALLRGSQSNFNRAGTEDGSPYEYQGQIAGFAGAGRLDLWTYNNQYDVYEPDGNILKVSYLDQGSVVGIGTQTKGIRAFGAILDRRAGFQAVDMFPKQWDEEDPSVSYTMVQSAPLMIPLRPNNSFLMKVVGDSTQNAGYETPIPD